MAIDCAFLFKLQYAANYLDVGVEKEVCSVFVATTDEAPVPNLTEVQNVCWISPSAITTFLEQAESMFTPWFKMEWELYRNWHTQFAGRNLIGH